MRKVRRILAAVLLALMVVMMCSTAMAEKEYELVKITAVPDASQTARLYAGTSGEDISDPMIEAIKAVVSSLGTLPTAGEVSVIYTVDPRASVIYWSHLTYTDGQYIEYGGISTATLLSELQKGKCYFVLVEKELPKTGDATPIALLAVLLAGSAAGIIALRRRQAQGV